ncbi:MAG: UDP-3-O-(3-hydroxymyristoyl)glucosamine N-acyltransferase [Acidithiobacillus sp.]|nr:UDP-3-O-(3-hydroxymyristoyl)glucosamine N-acyltransferase [Acidithiobacillus sp.]
MISSRASQSYSLAELAVRLELPFQGQADLQLTGVAALHEAGPGDLSFLHDPKWLPELAKSQAAAVILPEKMQDSYAGNALWSKNPYLSFARVMQIFHPAPACEPGRSALAVLDPEASIDPSARIEDFVRVDARAVIGPEVWLGTGVVVGAGSTIARGSRLYPGVKVYANCSIGQNCILHANTVIGADGFGFAESTEGYQKIPQIGGVRIGNDVEIGANSCIDRGTLGDTIIADGVKIDNLVQIGHNVEIGAHSVIAGQSGVAGSTRIGSRCRIGGQVGFAGHLQITDGVVIAGQSAITRDIRQAGVYVGVIPAQEARSWRRLVARLRQLNRRTQDSVAVPEKSSANEE